MPPSNKEIIELAADLASNENLRVSITESLKCGFVTGASTILGGVALGRYGVMVGAILGSFLATRTCSNFRPAAEILLNDLNPEQQARLVNLLKNVIMENLPAGGGVALAAFIASRRGLRENVVNVIRSFISNDLHYLLAD